MPRKRRTQSRSAHEMLGPAAVAEWNARHKTPCHVLVTLHDGSVLAARAVAPARMLRGLALVGVAGPRINGLVRLAVVTVWANKEEDTHA